MMRNLLCLALIGTAAAFAPAMPATLARRGAAQPLGALRMAQGASSVHEERRRALQVLVTAGVAVLPLAANADSCSRKDCQPQANYLPEGTGPKKKDFTSMSALEGKDYGKTRMKLADYTETETGLQFKDVKKGKGVVPTVGDRVVYDWEGYTIGYYGRIFQAKNGVKGGAFDKELDYQRFVAGQGTVVSGVEEGLLGMQVGGVRQLVVPSELGYPATDASHEKVGPKPATFDGQRALNFVLFNQGLIDKTLLFNVKLIRVDKSDGNGGFIKGDAAAAIL
ncbi:hypothetical protein T484DRAFT_1983201 [Baffinella frigidus]|nr:hypothetical protein T484DRAFT_1983201 [Cryptophyta sp. CCMP2293]